MLMQDPEVDSRHLGSATGMFFCVSEIGGVMGPVIVGALVDSTGSFLAGICFLAALSLIILAVTFLLRTSPASCQEVPNG